MNTLIKQTMTQINGYLIVPVPEGAKYIHFDSNEKALCYSLYGWKSHSIPEGDWSIVEIDERVAEEIVEHFTEGRKFIDYVNYKEPFDTALESYSSLLKSKGYENVVLLKKKNI
jgi:hypothetical protein